MVMDISEEDRVKANQELHELYEWERKKTEEAINKLKGEGRFRGGLDGKYEEIDIIREERKRRFNEILKKYRK